MLPTLDRFCFFDPLGHSPANLSRWSNRWTTGKGFHCKVAPMVQRMDHRGRFPPPRCTDGPTNGPPGRVSPAKVLRWSNRWTTWKGFHCKVAPMVQRMDHRGRFPPPRCTDGPTDGPPGKVSPAKLHRWSNGWTTGQRLPQKVVNDNLKYCLSLPQHQNKKSPSHDKPDLCLR